MLKHVSEDEFAKACYQLITKTDYFDIYVKNDVKEIQKTDYAIQIILEYLKGVSGSDGVTGRQFRTKFNEIQAQLHEDISGTDQNPESPFNFGMLFDNFKLSPKHFR